jgi:hypothetical protein
MQFNVSRWRLAAAMCVALCWSASAAAQAVSFTGNYTQNFDSMGATGTAPPAGWGVFGIAGSSGNDTSVTPHWTNLTGNNNTPPNPAAGTGGIPNGTEVAGGNQGTISANDNPTASNANNAYNATGAGGAADRTIVTSGTGNAGNVIQLQLTNNTGAAQNGLTIAYSIVRKTQAPDSGRSPPAGIPEGAEELPGFWLFYSLDNGTNYTAVRSLIPVGEGSTTQPVVPNTVGVTNIAPTQFTFTGPWANGATLFLRWVDDNAIDPSPDQFIGLDNLAISPIPEPSVLLLTALGLGGGFVARRYRRGKVQQA